MATITLPRRPAMTADGAPDRGAAKGPLPLPVLLADRQEVAFVATPRGIESLRIPPRYWGAQVGVVAIPVSDEEVRGAELQPSSDAGAWPRVVTRPDLLAPALSRLLAGEHTELSLQPGRNGLKATLLTPADEEQPFPVAPKDALGFLAAVFQHAPRGVVKTAGGRARRVLLSVRPAARPHEYRGRIIGVVEAPPPATLADIGLSPAVMELIFENPERRARILLGSGGPGAGPAGAPPPAVPVAVLGQTIVRTPCRGCLGWTSLPAAQARRLGFHRRDVGEIERKGGLAVVRGAGCAECARTGAAGLTGVQEFIDPEEGVLSLPRLREAGWRKAVQGLACVDDVVTLSGAQRPMRTLREIVVHAGLSSTAPEGAPNDTGEATGGARDGASAKRGSPVRKRPEASSEPALVEAKALVDILKDGRSARSADGKGLSALATLIASRAASEAPLGGLLAPSSGFRLASHSVNVALIASRVGAALGGEEDHRLILLALVHDAGMVKAGIDPDAELPAAPSEETLDPEGNRL